MNHTAVAKTGRQLAMTDQILIVRHTHVSYNDYQILCYTRCEDILQWLLANINTFMSDFG